MSSQDFLDGLALAREIRDATAQGAELVEAAWVTAAPRTRLACVLLAAQAGDDAARAADLDRRFDGALKMIGDLAERIRELRERNAELERTIGDDATAGAVGTGIGCARGGPGRGGPSAAFLSAAEGDRQGAPAQGWPSGVEGHHSP